MAWNQQNYYRSCPRPHTNRFWHWPPPMPINNNYPQPPYWRGPHASNYRRPFWQGQWRGDFHTRPTRPPMPQMNYHIPPPSFIPHSQNIVYSEPDLTNHQNTEPPQIEWTEHSTSPENENRANLEPNAETNIDSKSANPVDILVPSASEDNLLSPLETKNDTHGKLVKNRYPSVNLFNQGIISGDSESSEVQDSPLIAGKAKSEHTVDFESSNLSGAILNPIKDTLLKSRDFVSITNQQDTLLKPKKHKLKKSHANKLLKRDAQHSKSPNKSSITSGGDANRAKLHKPPSNHKGTKSSNSLHSNPREALKKLPDTKKLKSCDAKQKVKKVYLSHKQSSSKKPIDSENSKDRDSFPKPLETKSMKSDTVSSKLANSSSNLVITTKSKISVDTVSPKLGNSHVVKTTEAHSLMSGYCKESKKLHDSSLTRKEVESNKCSNGKYLERRDAISEPKEPKSLKPSDNASTIHDLSVMAKNENMTKPLDKAFSTLFHASLKPQESTEAKSIMTCGTENKISCVSSPAFLKSKSKKECVDEKALKCYDVPLKASCESINSRNEEETRTKLKDSSLMPGESTPKKFLKINEVRRKSKDNFLKPLDFTSDSTPSQDVTNTHLQPEEATSMKTVYVNNSTRRYSTLSPLETKSKKSYNISREKCRVSKSDQLKSSQSLGNSKPLDCPLNPSEHKDIKSRDPLNTKTLDSSRTEGAKLMNYDGPPKVPADVNVMMSRGDASKTKQDIDLPPEETGSTKSIHDKTLKQCGSSSNSSDAKSIRLCTGKSTELQDFFMKPIEADSKKFVKKRKCPNASFKYSEVKKMKSCYVNIAKLPDSRLKHDGSKLKSSFISKCFKRDGFYSKSQATENTKHQEYPSKPGEVKPMKSLSSESSKSNYASSRHSEGKSVMSWLTESKHIPKYSSKLKEYKLKKSLDSTNSKGHYPHSKPLEDKSAKTRYTESKTLYPSSKPEVTNCKNPPYDRTTESNNTSLKPSRAKTAKCCDTEGTKDESRNPSSKSYEAKTKNPFQKVESKYVPLKHVEAKSIKLCGDERLKSKSTDENMTLEYLDATKSNMFVTSPNPSKANLNNSFKIEGSNHIEDGCIKPSKHKLIKFLEPASTIVGPAELVQPPNDSKTPLNHKAKTVRTPESQSIYTLNEGHGTTTFDPFLLTHNKSSKFIKTGSAKPHKCVKSDKDVSKGSIQAECPYQENITQENHTGKYLLPQKPDPLKNLESWNQTADTISEHISNSFSSIKHLSSKTTKFHRVVSSDLNCHEADSINSYTLEHCKLAKAKCAKHIGPEGISPYEAGSFKQSPPAAIKPLVPQTKKRIAHERHEPVPKKIKCFKYKNNEHILPQPVDFITDSLKNSLGGEISTFSEAKATSENTPSDEDCQSKQEQCKWTSRLKIGGLHLMKEQSTTSEIRIESANSKPRIYPSAKPPTTLETLKTPIHPSTVNSGQELTTQHTSTDCPSRSLKPNSRQTAENSTKCCKPFDPLKCILALKNVGTTVSYCTSGSGHPHEYKKLSYSENNNDISEVCHYDIFSPFASPICYSPVTPPKVDYASSTSNSFSPGPYVYTNLLQNFDEN